MLIGACGVVEIKKEKLLDEMKDPICLLVVLAILKPL
jgi:hypothetical protein